MDRSIPASGKVVTKTTTRCGHLQATATSCRRCEGIARAQKRLAALGLSRPVPKEGPEQNSVVGTCPHGLPNPTQCPDCQEIQRIVSDDPDRLLRKEQRYRVSLDAMSEGRKDAALVSARRLGAGTVRATIPVPHLFDSVEDVLAAALVGAISPVERAYLIAQYQVQREHQLLGAGSAPTWPEIARRVKRHPRTVQKVMLRVQARLGTGQLVVTTRPVGLIRSRERGYRRTKLWIKYEARAGDWRRTWNLPAEDVPEDEIGELAFLSTRDRKLISVPNSEMRLWAAALITHITGGGISESGELLKADPHWQHNVRWAERRLGIHRNRQLKYSEALRIVARGLRLCGNCHALILAGCYVGAVRINASRRYCSDGCKMAASRSRTGHGGLRFLPTNSGESEN